MGGPELPNQVLEDQLHAIWSYWSYKERWDFSTSAPVSEASCTGSLNFPQKHKFFIFISQNLTSGSLYHRSL